MSEEDIELPEEDLPEEEIEERDTFSSSHLDTVDSPLLDFFLGGGLSLGGRERNVRVQQGEIDRYR